MKYDERKEAEAYERGLNAGRLDAAKDLAAAEERGRRRGEIERDELRRILERLVPAMNRASKSIFLSDTEMSALVEAQVALAPRDSGKET